MNDILFVYEMEEIVPTFESVDLGGVVRGVVDEYRARAARSNLAFVTDLPPALPPIQGNAKNLERAFKALLDNAVKFSPEGGRVRVTASAAAMILCVAVSDSGIGIPAAHLPRIFERFYHVDEIDGHRFGGVGLGLAIAKHLVERHGGRIEATSSGVPGEGAVFRVNLPIS